MGACFWCLRACCSFEMTVCPLPQNNGKGTVVLNPNSLKSAPALCVLNHVNACARSLVSVPHEKERFFPGSPAGSTCIRRIWINPPPTSEPAVYSHFVESYCCVSAEANLLLWANCLGRKKFQKLHLAKFRVQNWRMHLPSSFELNSQSKNANLTQLEIRTNSLTNLESCVCSFWNSKICWMEMRKRGEPLVRYTCTITSPDILVLIEW